MAPWMKWLLAALGACLGVALLVLVAFDPVERAEAPELLDPKTGERNWRHPLVQRVWRIQNELAAANEALRQQVTLAAAYDAVPAEPGVALELNLGPWNPNPRVAENAWAQRLKAERDSALAQLPGLIEAQAARHGGSRSRIAVVGVPEFRTREHEDFFFDASAPVRYFAGRDERGGFCIVAIETYVDNAWVPDAVLFGANPLGPCRLWARYGDPGPAVLAWLGKAGHLMDLESPLPEAPRPGARRLLFGFRAGEPASLFVQPIAGSCLAGRRDACLPAALDRSVWIPWRRTAMDGPALHARGRWAAWTVIGSMFGDLERDLGAEAFGRFWRSDGAAEEALEAELGEDVGGWMMRWLREHFGAEPLGPTVPTGTLILSLLTILALIGAGAAVAMRRQAV